MCENSFYAAYKKEKDRFIKEKHIELKNLNYTQDSINDYFKSDDFILDNIQNLNNFTTTLLFEATKELEETNKSFLAEKHENYLHIHELYGNAFTLFSLYLDSVFHIGNEYYNITSKLYEQSEQKDMLLLFKILNGKAILIAQEILCLLENGFPHGAVARWRTLYEIWITMSYISLHDNNMAIKFLTHEESHNNYSWAESNKVSPAYGKKYSFSDIQKYVHDVNDKDNLISNAGNIKYSNWANEYTISNKVLHLTQIGVFGYWDKRQKNQLLNTGYTDVGLLKPASNTIRCLYNINLLTFSMLDVEYGNFALLFLKKISEKIDSYLDESDKNIK